jgi:transcriptional regulator with XRE-family HTH domain
MSDESRRRELAHFLRRRREDIDPADLGLRRDPRRRTPGLRREEVAVLAGISPTWYTYLEQARSVLPSAKNLDGIAGALRLSDAERIYLTRLARREPAPRRTAEPDVTALSEITKALDPVPALVLSRFGDVLAFNDASIDCYTDFGRLPDRERNLVYWIVTAGQAPERLAGWEGEARAQVARLRWAAAGWYGHPRLDTLVGGLTAASTPFRGWWEEHTVHAPGDRISVIRHARDGRPVTTRIVETWGDEPGGTRLVLHLPA